MAKQAPSQAKTDPFDLFEDFFNDLQQQDIIKLHSIHLVGTALTSDYDERVSDINSIVVLPKMDLRFIEYLAPLGRKHKPRRIAAPLIMTPDYITSSLNTFPVEFLSYKLIHRTVFGPDILAGLTFKRKYMQLQCNREIKSKLIWLRQAYLNSYGDERILKARLSEAIIGFFPLFRALLALNGRPVPKTCNGIVGEVQRLSGVETGIFKKMFLLRHKQLSLDGSELVTAFEELYDATEKILTKVDVSGH